MIATIALLPKERTLNSEIRYFPPHIDHAAGSNGSASHDGYKLLMTLQDLSLNLCSSAAAH